MHTYRFHYIELLTGNHRTKVINADTERDAHWELMATSAVKTLLCVEHLA